MFHIFIDIGRCHLIRYLLYCFQNVTKFYDSSVYGVYEGFKPVLVTWDTEIIKHIFIKDFDHFTNRRDFNLRSGHYRDEMISEMLFLKQGAEWKSLRGILSPTFTSGKIKSMFPLVCDKADALVNISIREASENPQVDMKRNFSRYTSDTIASCAFGIESNAVMGENDIFISKVEPFITFPWRAIMKGTFYALMPRLFRLFGLSVNPAETDFFIDLINRTVAARLAGQKRGDFLDLLLEAREDSDNPNSKHSKLYVLSFINSCVFRNRCPRRISRP